MKKIMVALIAVFSMCFLVACGGEVKQEPDVNGSSEVEMNNESVVPDTTVKPTEAPAPEATPEPTPEPTADPVETLTTLREEAMVEQDKIVESLQTKADIVPDILAVVKEYPNFKENDTYEMVLWAQSIFEKDVLTGDINNIIGAVNCINTAITDLLVEYPELKNTEEFKKLIEVPIVDTVYYNGYASVYNDTLANSTATGFEELPYCIVVETKIEY